MGKFRLNSLASGFIILILERLIITIHHCRLCRAYKENRTAQKWIVMAAQIQTALASITKKSIEFIGKMDVNPMMILFQICSSKCKISFFIKILMVFSNNRNGVNEPSKKRTRFETDKQRQERLAQEKTRRKEHQVRKIV